MNSKVSYSRWSEAHKSFLKSLSDKNIVMLFSGGKDSSLAMDLISRAGKEFGFDFEAHAGAFPVHRYTEPEKKRIESYWGKRDIKIFWHKLAETDDQLGNAENPCLPCQKLRKKMLSTLLSEMVDDWKSLVLIVSYSLWDIVSYSIENVLTDVFVDFKNEKRAEKNRRFLETGQRFYPILRMKGGYTIFRPLIACNGHDILEMLGKSGIPSLSIPCKFSEFRPKRILEKYYEKMGMSFDYSRVFDFAKESLNLPDLSSYTSMEKEEYLLHLF